MGSVVPKKREIRQIAESLSANSRDAFLSVRLADLLDPKTHETKGTSTQQYLKFHSQIIEFVANSVLSKSNVEERAEEITKWVSVGKACLKNHDYMSAYAIHGALNNTYISRLDNTMKLVPKKARKFLSHRSFPLSGQPDELAKEMKRIKKIKIPFLGAFFTRVYFAKRKNQSKWPTPESLQRLTENKPQDFVSIIPDDSIKEDILFLHPLRNKAVKLAVADTLNLRDEIQSLKFESEDAYNLSYTYELRSRTENQPKNMSDNESNAFE